MDAAGQGLHHSKRTPEEGGMAKECMGAEHPREMELRAKACVGACLECSGMSGRPEGLEQRRKVRGYKTGEEV